MKTNGLCHGVTIDQHAREGQFCDSEFTICKFVTKAHIQRNFMYQIGVFLIYIYLHTKICIDTYVCRQFCDK
jgi:hypothetical protein